jgi:predicted MFS family arabinose efflux permease
MRTEARVVAFVCAAEILGLAGFSLVPALLPQFIATWSLSNPEAGWLASMMSNGYMAGVLPLVALTDRIPARTIFLVCSTLSALSSFGIALSDALPPALVWREVGGIALAGMYMPGLLALTDGMEGARRARAAGASLVIVPHVPSLDWLEGALSPIRRALFTIGSPGGLR